MDPKVLKLLGIICLVICVVLLFVAYERYQTNAKNVRAMNRGPIRLPGGGTLETNFDVFKPAMPAATKYGLFFAVLSAGGSVVCFIASKPKSTVETSG
jgi:hypothetical protein